ncbi:MAG: anti-anti-sigma factor [Sphingobacteriales bacterium 41-5]|nr:MAG: anti-anti-sigma factor [Sphingobacteriales bacterium 41-5]
MQVKIDTKEKFHVITPVDTEISATMADGMRVALLPFLQSEVKNVVLNLENVTHIDEGGAEQLLQIQQEYYQENASFVSCCLQKPVEDFLTNSELIELFNITPTESEAWDIVQMEEIERELMDGEDWEEAE